MASESQLIEKIKREFGFPYVKVEVDDYSIKQKIDQAIQKYIKHAAGNATQETFFTMPISAGVSRYKLPVGVTEVLTYEDMNKGLGSQINTLFTVDNYLYNQGMYDPILWPGQSNQFSMVSYHIALDFLETMGRYMQSRYSWKYHKHKNELEILPVPTYNDGKTFQYAMLKCMLIEGTELNDTEINYGYFYDKEWIFNYSVALCKKILGEVRRKFENMTVMGNTGLSLNGSAMLNEASTEIRELEEQLKIEEAYDGFGISVG